MKMRKMIMVKNRRYKAFFNLSEKEKAEELRKSDIRMKYARITEILQAFPSKIKQGEIYNV
jgi:hypothetical protein